jgi:hypothetical protein
VEAEVAVEAALREVPLWGVFLFTVVLSLAALEVGVLLGRRRKRQQAEGEPAEEVGALVGAMLGLLGFVLAITFGTQLSRFDALKQLELEEATSVHATWLQADMLPSPYRERVKQLLEDYVDVRIEKVRNQQVQQAIEISQELQDEIWAEAIAGTEQGSDAFPKELFMESLTEMVKLHERRVTVGLYQSLPFAFWLALVLLTLISMAVTGYHGGVTGSSGLVVRILTVVAFAMLIMMIADLNRPGQGLLRVRQLPLLDTQSRMAE